ncbi:uncharacterized protein Bfra_010609 [Botrytis fragariae]|uniref:Uncharacterized protein n=1 Tax=Botrytis fragariae TaxID=1964551 RepID=A0A8H6AHW9_9HELO|nr:uncharacterized protein Bfra_010609 [Botrytis fragariae]KAF5867634.1 hypothetical protein Bfra_010609 [Botrytis fragariae]
MELPKYDSRSISNPKNLPPEKVHKSGSGSRDILREQEKTFSGEDLIMSDENWSYITESEDTYMDDDYYTDGTHTGDTTIYRPSSGLAPQVTAPVKSYAPVQAPQKRYVPAPRRYRGILDPYEGAEDAAFFAHANTRYQQGIREALRKSEEKCKEEKSRSARKENTGLTTRTNAAPAATGGGKINFIDLLWGKQKATGSGGISFPGFEKKMAPKAGVKKPKPKSINTKSRNKRIEKLCTVIFGDVEPKSKLHQPSSTFLFINCDPEDIKHLIEDHRECYRLISDYKWPFIIANPYKIANPYQFNLHATNHH